MFTVTFYSYKGGVGRTLALLNAAYVLAKGSARVAVIDFDLEAPGVDSIDPFRPDKIPKKGGIVEYISSYTKLEKPNPEKLPSLKDYSYSVKHDEFKENVTIIPAGLKDKNYLECYSGLNWLKLYKDYQGYDFFDNLKKKIVKEFEPDYLLIDARTGLADISGITTFQLADLVVLVFNLNPQNTDGIIRHYNSLINAKRRFQIHILAAVSPVPMKDIPNFLLQRYDDICRRVSNEMRYVVGSKMLQLNYDPWFAFDDIIFTKKYPDDPLSGQYNDIIRKIKDVFEDDIPYYFEKIKQYINNGKDDEAGRFAQELITMRPHDVRVYVHYATLLIEKGDYTSALSVLTQAEGLINNNPSVLDTIANIYFIKRDIPNYIAYIKKLYSAIIRENHYPVSDELESFDDLETFNELAATFLETKMSYVDFDKGAFIEGLQTRGDFTPVERIALLTVILNEKLSPLQVRQLSEVLRPKDEVEVVQDFGILAYIDIVGFTPQSLEAGDFQTTQLLNYYYEEVTKAAKSCNFEFIKSVGDAVLLFGKQPKDFLKLVDKIFVTRCVADNYGFDLKFRMVANAGFYHFQIDKRGGKDPIGSETIRLFRLEKLANTWELVVMHELFVGLHTYLNEFRIQYLPEQLNEPLKGFEFLGTSTAYYRLLPPVKDDAARPALSDQYRAARLKLYDESKLIPIFANLYPAINMDENFLDLTLDKPTLKGSDYLRTVHYKEGRHGIHGPDDEDDYHGPDDKTIKASEILKRFNKGFIFGLPGAGKTTILRYIAYQALKQNIDANIIFVNCRDLRQEDLPGVKDENGESHLSHSLPDVVTFLTRAFLFPGKPGAMFNLEELRITKKTAEAMFQAWQKKELIVAVDAIDESPSTAVRDAVIDFCYALMREIPSDERDENAAAENIVYATSRIAELQIVAPSGQRFFYVNPITMEQMRAMARRFWGEQSLLYAKFDDEIWRNYAAKNLGGTPLTAMLLLFYYETLSDFGMRYNTYDIIMKFILMRIANKLKEDTFREQFSNMHEFIRKAGKKDFLKSKENAEIRYRYDALSSLAFARLYEDKPEDGPSRTFNEETLKGHLMTCNVPEGCDVEKLTEEKVAAWIDLFKKDHLLIPSGYTDYIFLHSTVMEFLAGRHYISQLGAAVGKDFKWPFTDKMEGLEALPIAAGDGYKTGAEILDVMRPFYDNKPGISTLPFRCLSETEAVENYEINKLGTERLREDERKEIDKLLPKKEWAYRYIAGIVLNNNKEELEKLSKRFGSVIPLCRNKLFDYLEGWVKFNDTRKSFLKVVIEQNIFESQTGLQLKEAAKGITSYLQYKEEEASSLFDTNFTYYENHISYESEKAITPENRKKILKGFFGSPNFKHSGIVFALAMSPDGKFLATASGDFTLKLWDLETCREVRTFFGHQWLVRACVFTQDGSEIISGSWDNTLKLWDIKTGELIRTFSGHQDRVSTCILTQDGSGIISGSWDRTLKLWDIKTGEVIRTFSGHKGEVYTCIQTQDGSGIISGSWDMTLKLWDIKTGEVIRTFSGHQGGVNTCILKKDGRGIISGADDKTLNLWDIKTGEVIRTFSGHQAEVSSCIVTQDGSGIISGSYDKTLNLWD
ncbi:MAG: AAA family ATPase, partial [Nitrospirae bacterium]|nr:AAA family ATPase [Nitrospirota bacterium]